MAYHIVTNSNTASVVQRIKDELIDTLNFRNKLEIAISDILIFFLESETESKEEKSGEARPGFIAYLLSDRYPIQKLEIPNLKFEIPN